MSAEYLFKKYIEDQNISGFTADSAGTVAYDFESPYTQTLKRLRTKGISITYHKNKRVNHQLIEQADVIICMSEHHRTTLKNRYDCTCVLFNELAYGKTQDVFDDNETDYNNLTTFIYQTVDALEAGIPHIVNNLQQQ